MAWTLLDTGCLRVTVRYVRDLKGDGRLWYYRRIPEYARPHHGNQQHRRKSLGTRDPKVAAVEAAKLATADDAFWSSLRTDAGKAGRITNPENQAAARALLTALGLAPGDLRPGRPDEPGKDPVDQLDDYFHRRYGDDYLKARHNADRRYADDAPEDFFEPFEREAVRLLREGDTKPPARLSDALAVYLKGHKRGHQAKFSADAHRVFKSVYGAVGDLPLADYRRDHANKVRDAFLASGNKTNTARRRLNTVTAVFTRGLREFDLQSRGNPFEGLQIAREGEDAEEVVPFTVEELRAVSKACRAQPDDIRLMIALQLDTGARLGEIVGLHRDEVVLEADIPHIVIQPHPHLGRTLKTPHSERKVPLVGEALWAAQQVLTTRPRGFTGQSDWVFPRYAEDGDVRSGTASATVNKWLRGLLEVDKTSHSFRHAMRDRLRQARVPEPLQDQLGGWGERSMGQGYGEGYSLEVLRDEIVKVVWTAVPSVPS